MTTPVTTPTDIGEDVRRQLGAETVIRIAVQNHPRFTELFEGLDSLYAWLGRAQRHYLNEIDRIGPTKARLQIRRIVNEVASVGPKNDLADRCLAVFTEGLHHADPLTFAHEAERLETMPPSPLVRRMRAVVDAERELRTAVAA